MIQLRPLLERCGTYSDIEAASKSDELGQDFPVTLFEHIGIVYDRLGRVADASFANIAPLRLAVLVHEQSPASLPSLLAGAGFSDFAPIVLAIIGGFGELWKTKTEHEIAEYVLAHRGHLASLLLFELAHEGRATRQMERAAELGDLGRSFKRWAARLPP